MYWELTTWKSCSQYYLYSQYSTRTPNTNSSNTAEFTYSPTGACACGFVVFLLLRRRSRSHGRLYSSSHGASTTCGLETWTAALSFPGESQRGAQHRVSKSGKWWWAISDQGVWGCVRLLLALACCWLVVVAGSCMSCLSLSVCLHRMIRVRYTSNLQQLTLQQALTW